MSRNRPGQAGTVGSARAVDGARSFRVDFGEGDTVWVLSLPRCRESALIRGLTSSEARIVDLVLDGRSNSEIAALRGSSVNTVANQLKSVFRKLRCSSRRELAARLRAKPAPEKSR